MKKIIAIVLAVITVLSLAACGSESKGNESADNTLNVENAEGLLTVIWDSYPENERFSAIGGDADNNVDDAPGTYDLKDTAALNSAFGLTEEMAGKVDDAASLMHMMNANTFTCVALHVKEAGDVTAVTDALKESIMSRQWMCGFPDKLLIVNIGDYVISVFGNQELVDNFMAKTAAAYESASVVCDEPIL